MSEDNVRDKSGKFFAKSCDASFSCSGLAFELRNEIAIEVTPLDWSSLADFIKPFSSKGVRTLPSELILSLISHLRSVGTSGDG